MSKFVTGVIVFIGIVIALMLLFIFPINKIPKGIPADYFDRINLIEKNGISVYMYSDEIDFNGDLEAIKISSIDAILPVKADGIKVIVIDMKKEHDYSFSSEDDLEYYYKNLGYFIFIVNYDFAESQEYSSIIDIRYRDSDLIILGHYLDDGTNYISKVSSDLTQKQILMYAILDHIGYIQEELG